MEIQRYEDWSLGLNQRAVLHRIPLGGSIEVTRRCPHKCVHCYNNLPLADEEARRSELIQLRLPLTAGQQEPITTSKSIRPPDTSTEVNQTQRHSGKWNILGAWHQ